MFCLPASAILVLFAVVPLSAAAILYARDATPHTRAGYPVGNFGICAQVGEDGSFLPALLVNPSELGDWLQPRPGGALIVQCESERIPTSEFANIHAGRAFPFAKLMLQDERLPGIEVGIRTFCPVADHDSLTTSLPLVMAEITVTNASAVDRTLRLEFQPHGNCGASFAAGNFQMHMAGDLAWGFQGGCAEADAPLAQLEAPAGDQARSRFICAWFHPEGGYRSLADSLPDLVRYAADNWDGLREATDRFSSLMPSIGDAAVDLYTRWYCTAGIFLTRVTREAALTMGYCELNQRDSFWSSYIHLVFWPDLERRMLEESAAGMRADGKIPTTILPVIDRHDDLDINAYFVIRLKRYVDFTGDRQLLLQLWPAVKRGMAWLEARDAYHDGMLEQDSYWGDWKDVQGVDGRVCAPHFELVWLAALQAAAQMALVTNDRDAREHFEEMAARTRDTINRPLQEGGLWNGRFYTSRWTDGRDDRHVQEDQLVGAVLGLIPPERLAPIYQALAPALAPWGMRETYPFRKPFSHAPGVYHNGGVWPFMSFMDALGRWRNGYPEEAEEIVRRVGYADLERDGDWLPHEYLHGKTGQNCGPVIQAWNADLFAAIVWGAYGLQVLDRDVIQIAPCIPPQRPVTCALRLPQGVVWVEQKPSPGKAPAIHLRSGTDCDLRVRFGRWSEQAPANTQAQRHGTGWMTWTHITLPAGGTAAIP